MGGFWRLWMHFRVDFRNFRLENRLQNLLKTADKMWISPPEPEKDGGFGTTRRESLKFVFHTGKLFGVSLWKTAPERGKQEVLHLFRRLFHNLRISLFSQGKTWKTLGFFGFPYSFQQVFHLFPQLFHSLWKTLWKLWEKGLEDGKTGGAGFDCAAMIGVRV